MDLLALLPPLRSSIAVALVGLASASAARGAGGAFVEPTLAERAAVDSVVAGAARLPTTRAQLDFYRSALRRASAAAEARVAIALVAPFAKAANELPRQRETLVEVNGLLDVVAREGFPPWAATHFETEVARSEAFFGNIKAAERRLLAIVARPDDQLHGYTAARAHYAIAYCAYYSDQLERGARHICAAAELFRSLGRSGEAVAAYDGAAATYLKMGQADTALFYARRARSLAPEIASATTLNLALNHAEALMVVGRVDSALHYATRAAAYAGTEGTRAGRARVHFALGNIYMALRRYRTARGEYQRASEAFWEVRDVYNVAGALDSLGRACAKTGDFEAAYTHRVRAFHLRDSVREDRLDKDAATRAAELERDRLAGELATSEAERARAEAKVAHRAGERLAAGVTGASLVLALAFVIYRWRERARTSATLQELVDARTAELRERGEALASQAARLTESNAELERFAYVASHDLKTPLRNVTSFLGLIRRRLPAEARALVSDYLEIAMANAHQMNELISDVLEFSRVNADVGGLAESTTVSAVVEDVRRERLAELDERGARLTIEGDAAVELPPSALRQLLGNLVGNGLKYNRSPAPEVRVAVVDLGARVRIAVADNGIGIDPAYHDRIFEAFGRLHTADEFEGTGVGLAACRKIVLRLGGTIAVDSAPDQGSVFTVELPKAIPDRRDGQYAPASVPASASTPSDAA